MKDYVGIEPDDWKGAALFFAKEVSLDKKQDLQDFDAIEWLDLVENFGRSIESISEEEIKKNPLGRVMFDLDDTIKETNQKRPMSNGYKLALKTTTLKAKIMLGRTSFMQLG